jgi:hypothetical protein
VNDRGSVAPLGIGLAMLSLAAVMVFVSASSLFVMQKRLTTMAEAAALSEVSNGTSVSEYLLGAGVTGFHDLKIAKESQADGVTVEVTLCASWQSPIRVLNLLRMQVICSSGAAR